MPITSWLSLAAIFTSMVLGQIASGCGSPSSTANVPRSTTSSISSLVSQLPTCALPCLESAATAIGCNASDLTCLCSKSSQLANNIGPCILFSSCNSSDQTQLLADAQEICLNLGSAQPSQVAAASSYIASAVASESASTANGNIAVRTHVPVTGVGVMGTAAALVILAL